MISGFKKMGKFHPPGLAPAVDDGGACHIDVHGKAAYTSRFLESFGFYQNLACVKDVNGFFHINPSGMPIYDERYLWCGNFQENRCVVCDKKSRYFHINLEGKSCYSSKYVYAGDYRDGIAVVRNAMGECFHIDRDGHPIYDIRFLDADVFHKGIARAKDDHGWFHIDMSGHSLYSEHYAAIDHFYNEVAHVETFEGEKKLINLQGRLIRCLESKKTSLLSQVSHDLVSFWKAQALAFALDLKIFLLLPQDMGFISKRLNINIEGCEYLLKALWEMGYTKPLDLTFFFWKLTPRGQYLKQQAGFIHKALAHVWGDHHYNAWHFKKLYSVFSKNENERDNYFQELAAKEHLSVNYQETLKAYAKEDYEFLRQEPHWSRHKIIIDAGGGHGGFIHSLLDAHTHLKGYLMDLPQVIKNLRKIIEHERCEYISLDFFRKWEVHADAIVLAKTLHDWSDECALKILIRAKEALLSNGRIYIVELIREKSKPFGALLNLNMYIMTGGKERTLDQWRSLIEAAGLTLESHKKGPSHLSYLTLLNAEKE